MVDSIAQSFFINIPSTIDGAFLTRLDLYFQAKDPNFGFTVELRAMDNLTGEVTTSILPYSNVYVPSSSIYTSSVGNVPTSVYFRAPVFVKNQTEYAFVVIPEANSPKLQLWCAQLGDTDLVTNKRVSEQPYTGVLFASSNLRTWTPVQEEDVKFKLYRASFDTSVDGTLVMNNDDLEFFTVKDADGWGFIGETVRGEHRLTLSTVTGGTIANNEIITGITSGSSGQIDNISGTTYRLKDIPVGKTFTVGESVSVKYANGATTGITATVASTSFPSGSIYFRDARDSDNIKLHLRSSGGTFIAGEQLRGQSSNNSCTIVSIDDLQMNVADIEIQKLDFTLTQSTWNVKTTTAENNLDAFKLFDINTNNYMNNEKKIASKTNESANLSGAKSFQLQGSFKTYSDYLSPIVNINRSHAVVIANIINNDDTGEDGIAGGNAVARHITQKVTLADGQDAEDLKAYITAFRPANATIEVYCKILNGEDSDTFDDIDWMKMKLNSTLLTSLDSNPNDFKEFEYTIDDQYLTGSNGEVQYTNSAGVTFTSFKYFVFKVVMLGTNTSLIPRLQDMRAIALQI